jgi:lipoteichoic acid synthase
MNYKKMIISFINVLYLETIYHLYVFKSFDGKNLFYILIFSLLTSLFIDLISSLFNKKINKWFFIGIIFICSIIFLAQYINYCFYGNIVSIYSVFHGGQVFGWLGAIISVIKEHLFPNILLFLPIPISLIFNKYIESSDINFQDIIKKIIILSAVFFISLISLLFNQKGIYSAYNLYFNKHVPNATAQNFGIFTTMRLDIERTLDNFEEASVTITPTIKETKTTKKTTEYNIDNFDFDNLIKNETNEEIKNIHIYMNNQDATNKNKYTGYFKGKNLISIVAESFSPIAVDKDLTPTLYKLVNTGFHFTNFYTPVYYVSTSDGEYVTLNSLLPKESVWSFYKSSSNYLPYAYGNIFKEMGYTTYAFHDGQYKFYNRNLSHPNMGYTYLACGNGLETKMHCKQWPESDIEMVDATFDYYGNSEHFATYYMTISGHLEYNFYGNNMAYKNKAYVENTNYSDAIKAYKAGQIELDKALEDLINKLDAAGKLKDTVIVLSADHYPYGLTTSQMAEVLNISDEKFDIHKNDLIIWNSEMKKPIEVDKLSESLDILPTVLNLFGIDYDSRLLMGNDILSDADSLVIFNDRSWITDYGKYNAATKVFTPNKNKKIPTDYVDKINEIVYNKYVISKNILETDYYRHLFNKGV